MKLLTKDEQVKALFEMIDQAANEGVIFHCSAEKDRTRVFRLVGMERKDLIRIMKSHTPI